MIKKVQIKPKKKKDGTPVNVATTYLSISSFLDSLMIY